MPVITDLQSLSHDAEIELFTLTEYNSQSKQESFRFCNHIGVVQGGVEYLPIACAIDGIQWTGEGSLPRPKLVVSDTQKILSGIIYLYDGIEGGKLKVHKTLRRYLDGQEAADANAEPILTESFVVSQCTQEVPGVGLEFELCAPIDLIDESVPARMAMTSCPWIYRGEDGHCPYSSKEMYTLDNKRTLNSKLDQCSKTVTSCALRFGRNSVLPHGGFPSLSRFS